MIGEYRKACSEINSKESLIKRLETELSVARSELNFLYQVQSEIFNKMEEEEDIK